MPTIQQLVRRRRKDKTKRTATQRTLQGCPQRRGVVLKTMVLNPKKPNSANRLCCRVRLSNGIDVTCKIPGEGHSLQEHSVVLVRGGGTPDLVGVKHKVIRGPLDCRGVEISPKFKVRRNRARSRYGTKRQGS